MDFNFRGYSRKEDHLVIFCSSQSFKNAKILLAYQESRRVAAFNAARNAWLKEDLTRPGEILEGCRCIIRLVSYSMNSPQARQHVQRPVSQKPPPVRAPMTVTKTAHHAASDPQASSSGNWKIHRVERPQELTTPPRFVRKPLPTMARIIPVVQEEKVVSEVPILVAPEPVVVQQTIVETLQSGLVTSPAPPAKKKFFMRR